MGNLETRIEKLEQTMGQMGHAPNIECTFVRPEDGFCCGHLHIRTGLEVTQRDNEADADFVVRAKAAGFERNDHEPS